MFKFTAVKHQRRGNNQRDDDTRFIWTYRDVCYEVNKRFLIKLATCHHQQHHHHHDRLYVTIFDERATESIGKFFYKKNPQKREKIVVAWLFTQSTEPEGKDFSIFFSFSPSFDVEQLTESLICETAEAASL